MSITKEDFDNIFDLIKEKTDYLELYRKSIFDEAKEKGLIKDEEKDFKNYHDITFCTE